MRVAVDVVGVEADAVEQLLGALQPALAGRDVGVHRPALGHDVADGHPRVQRAVGVLEDDLDLAAVLLERPAAHLGDVLTLVEDRAAGRLLQGDQQLGHGRLAAAGLADHADGLAAAQGQVDAVDGVDVPDRLLEEDALGQREVLLQARDLQQRLAGRRARAGRSRPTMSAGSDTEDLLAVVAGGLAARDDQTQRRDVADAVAAGRGRRRRSAPAGTAGGRRSRWGWRRGSAAGPRSGSAGRPWPPPAGWRPSGRACTGAPAG